MEYVPSGRTEGEAVVDGGGRGTEGEAGVAGAAAAAAAAANTVVAMA